MGFNTVAVLYNDCRFGDSLARMKEATNPNANSPQNHKANSPMTEHDAIRIISHLFSITPMFYVAVAMWRCGE